MPDPSITVEEGCTLIEALSAIHPEAKKNSLRRMISQGRTRIDGIRGEHPRQRVGPGATIVVLSRLVAEACAVDGLAFHVHALLRRARNRRRRRACLELSGKRVVRGRCLQRCSGGSLQ